MESFKEFLQMKQNVPATTGTTKPWHADKDEIVQYWKSARPDIPIMMNPMKNKPGTKSIGEDGIRITGSWNFIMSVIGRLKDIMGNENQNTRLRLIFKGLDKSKDPTPDSPSYVFYINLQERGKGKPGRPNKTKGIVPPTPGVV
jgi:hypothetical protein